MNYNLTSYTLSELRVIQAAIERQLEDLQAQITLAKQYLPSRMHADVTANDSKAMVILKEHNVHLLTAIQIVKDRETVNAN